MILSRNILKRVGDRTSLSDSSCCMESVSYAAVKENYAGDLVIQVFVDSYKVGADVYFFIAAHKPACKTLSKVFLKSTKTR